jgi:hypothetical protein
VQGAAKYFKSIRIYDKVIQITEAAVAELLDIAAAINECYWGYCSNKRLKRMMQNSEMERWFGLLAKNKC